MGSDRADLDPTPADRAFFARLAELDEDIEAPATPTSLRPGPGTDPDRWRGAEAVVRLLRRVGPTLARAGETRRGGGFHTPTDLTPVLPVERVGRFRVERVLGRGGGGVVYLATDPDLGRPVAVKVLRADDPEGLARFQTEAAALASLQHPGVVRVYEPGSDAGRPFLVMEYVPGQTLRELIRRGPLPGREAARVVAAVARAVAAAHRVGVIHRDLKPANILLAADGAPKVADFGLARRVGSAPVTEPGAALGTPGFMPPEMASGGPDRGGPAVDVYGLGAVLYKCLTAKPPFEGVLAFDTLRRIVQTDPTPPRRLNPAAPRDLEAVCLKCLEKNPADRYPTADAVADDLERFLAGRPTAARPAGPVRRVAKWAKRKARCLAVISTAAAVATAIAAAVLWRPDPPPEPAAPVAAAVPVPAVTAVGALGTEGGRVWGLAVSPDGATVAVNRRDGGVRLWDRAARRPTVALPTDDGLPAGGRFSADGRRLAFAPAKTRIGVWDVPAGQLLADHDFGRPVTVAAISPDGERVAVNIQSLAVAVWEVGTGRVSEYPPDTVLGPAAALAFSADGRFLLSGRQGVGVVTARSFQDGVLRMIAAGGAVIPGHLHALPGGRAVAFTGDRVVVLDPEHQTCVRFLPADPDPSFRPRCGGVAPSGTWAVTGEKDGTLRVWNLDTGRELARGPGAPATALAVGPDGLVVAAGLDGTLTEYRVTGVE